MGNEGFNRLPKHVRNAMLGGEDMRKLGRRGGIMAGRARRARKEAAEAEARERGEVFANELRKRRLVEARRMAYERGDHLLPDL